MNKTYKDVNDYIRTFPKELQEVLEQVRTTILEAAPGAEEGIAYGLPAYKVYGKPMVYFGAFRSHIGFYATPSGHAEFAEELSAFRRSKGSVQFPLGKEIPLDLVRRITQFRFHEIQIKYKE
ncbi:MAG: DUF1801 domain-containing protein [Bacteroidales bacterium]|nr:DUF1801 domain-containing protein [Bacteroidales bacterium]